MPRPLSDLDAGRGQLLDLVEELIRKRGAASVTLTELAAEAGMSPANIYRFFENKEALYEAVAERWFAPKIQIMEEVVESDAAVGDKLFDFFGRRFAMMRENYVADPVLFVSYLDLGDDHEESVRGYIDLGDHYLAMLVSEAIDQGHFSGLSIDEAVSLLNLSVLPFINPRLMATLMHSVNEDKLRLILDGLLAGLKGRDRTAENKPRLAAV